MAKGSKLLAESIADAKALREIAISNAKTAIEEAFTPKLKSIISRRIQNEVEDDEEEIIDDEEVVDNGEEVVDDEEEIIDDEEEEVDEGEEIIDDEEEEEIEDDEFIEGDEEEIEIEDDEEEEEDELDLESIIKELEGDEDDEFIEDDEEEFDDEEEEDELDLESIIRELDDEEEFDDDDEEIEIEDDDEEIEIEDDEEVEELKSENENLREALKILRDELNEVKLINQKMIYINKLFRENRLSQNQKIKVVENFDRAKDERETKLVYSTIAESLTSIRVNESITKKGKVKSTKPKGRKIISEGVNLDSAIKDRMQLIAGIKKDK